jgi:predicted CoA-binding protein
MPTREAVDDFLAQKHLAFVGVSRDPKQFANAVYRELRDHGRTLYPVNALAAGDPLEGDRSYPSLAEVPDPVDGVVVMVPAEQAERVVRAAVARGIPRVWLYHGIGPGSDSDEAVEACRAAGVSVVDGACPFMFDGPVHGMHHVHQVLSAHRILSRA